MPYSFLCQAALLLLKVLQATWTSSLSLMAKTAISQYSMHRQFSRGSMIYQA